MLIRYVILIALLAPLLSACSMTSPPKNGNFFNTNFSRNLEKVEIYIAGYETHVEETSTDIVDRKPSATLFLNCGASCYQDNLKNIDLSLSSARAIECYPTFFMQKFVLKSTNETIIFYLDFDGRQVKLEEQCYLLDDEYEFSVGDLGILKWEKRK